MVQSIASVQNMKRDGLQGVAGLAWDSPEERCAPRRVSDTSERTEVERGRANRGGANKRSPALATLRVVGAQLVLFTMTAA
jgi:hypothetical protein